MINGRAYGIYDNDLGGAICNWGNLTLVRCVLSGNGSSWYADGGAIHMMVDPGALSLDGVLSQLVPLLLAASTIPGPES